MANGYWRGLFLRAGHSNPDGTTLNFFKSSQLSASRKVPKIIQNGGEVVSHWVDKTITTAQILALRAAPITIVAAPGADKALIMTRAMMFYDFNVAAYAGIAAGENLVFRYTDGSGEIISEIETVGFLDQTNDELRLAMPSGDTANNVDTIIPVANAVIVLNLLVGEIITGDSPLFIRFFYNVISTNLS